MASLPEDEMEMDSSEATESVAGKITGAEAFGVGEFMDFQRLHRNSSIHIVEEDIEPPLVMPDPWSHATFACIGV